MDSGVWAGLAMLGRVVVVLVILSIVAALVIGVLIGRYL